VSCRSDPVGFDSGAVGADLRPGAADIGAIEAHRKDGVAAPGSASAITRSTTWLRLSVRDWVMPLSSPPLNMDFRPEPIWEPMFLDRTVRPETSPRTSVTSYPGRSLVVAMSMGARLCVLVKRLALRRSGASGPAAQPGDWHGVPHPGIGWIVLRERQGRGRRNPDWLR